MTVEVQSDQSRVAPTILDGIRIVDLSTGLAGPYATELLAEAGAEVIRLEPPAGDPTRGSAPAAHASWNRSKLSAVLPEDDDGILHALLARADVLVHGLTPAEATARELSCAVLAQRYPHLVVASVTGFPPGHPHEEFPADELLVQARIGAMDTQQGHRPGPVVIRVPFASWGAGFLLAGGILARLVQRERTNRVAPVHTSLVQGALVPTSLIWQRAPHLAEGMQYTLPKVGGPDLSMFQCADGQWIHGIGAGFVDVPEIVEALVKLDLVHLAAESAGFRIESRAEWARVFKTKALAEWLEIFRAADVPSTPVLQAGEILLEHQTVVNGYAVEVDDPCLGRMVQAGPPFATTPPSRIRHGAHELDGDVQTVAAIARDVAAVRARAPHPALPPDLPLAGLRVLDLGSFVASPFGAQCLGDLGADVVKVEPPAGERGRFIQQFTCCQRGKRAIAADIRHPATKELLTRLIRWADIVSHNFRPSAARRLGVDEASLKAINPKVILVHVSAYGSQGPWSEFPGYDPNAQALSGWEVGNAGEGNAPQYLRNSLMDPFTGLASCVAALLALFHRERTGQANAATTSLLALSAALTSETAISLPSRVILPVASLDRDQRTLSFGQGIYRTSDGWIAISAVTEAQVAQVAEIAAGGGDGGLDAVIAGRTSDELGSELAARGIPATFVALDYLDQFFDDELANGSDLIVRTKTADYGGWLDTVGAYWTLPDVPLRFVRSIPGLGEHAREVVAELGLSDEYLAELVAQKLVVAP